MGKLDEYDVYIPFIANGKKTINDFNISNLKELRNIYLWKFIKKKSDERLSYKDLIFLHKNISISQKCSGLPEEFIEIYKQVLKLDYKDKQNYNSILYILYKAKSIIINSHNNDEA